MTFMAMMMILFGVSSVFPEGTSKNKTIALTISSAQSLKMIKANRMNSNFIVLDVRTPEEYLEKRIKGSMNIDFRSPDFADKLNGLDKSKIYLIYCRSGHRSGQALQVMKDLNFRKVYNMNGGLNAWEAGHFPVDR